MGLSVCVGNSFSTLVGLKEQESASSIPPLSNYSITCPAFKVEYGAFKFFSFCTFPLIWILVRIFIVKFPVDQISRSAVLNAGKILMPLFTGFWHTFLLLLHHPEAVLSFIMKYAIVALRFKDSTLFP